MKPLNDIVILDLTRILAGPFCTMILADFGAEVIKVESPETGDHSRLLGPHVNGESAYFMSVNRGKKSVTLNLKTEEGRALLKEIVKKADVLVENFRPGRMEDWGLGYEQLKVINPKLIYASISGFGHSGPYMKLPAFDIVIQAMSGLMSITGQENGQPTRVGTSIGDIIPGMFGTIGIMIALYNRIQTGEGQHVDVAMFDSIVAILENAISRYQINNEVPKPIGNRHPAITPFDSFSTKDGYIIVAAGSPKLFEKLCEQLHLKDLLEDDRFSEYESRHQHEKELKQILEAAFSKYTQSQALDMLRQSGIPCAPINTIDNLFSDSQVKSRNMIVDVEHPVAGILKIPGVPVKLSLSPGGIENPAPILGQHTEHILTRLLNISEEQFKDMLNKGII